MSTRDPVQRAMFGLLKSSRERPAGAERVLLAHPDESVPLLLKVVEDHRRHEDAGEGWAVVHAVHLLCEMRADVVAPLLRMLEECDGLDAVFAEIIAGLAKRGAPVVAPCLAALEGAEDDYRSGPVEILSRCGVRDERIRTAIVEYLREEPNLGSTFVSYYGDETLLPDLYAVFDSLPLRPEYAVEDGRNMNEVVDAIRVLGGQLDVRRAGRKRLSEILWSEYGRVPF